jgi:hypothetical protein
MATDIDSKHQSHITYDILRKLCNISTHVRIVFPHPAMVGIVRYID